MPTRGRLLKLARVAVGLDQQELSVLSSVSQQQISLLEADSTSGVRTLHKVLKALADYEEDTTEQ